VIAFEARRAVRVARMLEPSRGHGALGTRSPRRPTRALTAIDELAAPLAAHEVAVLVLLTGVGTRALAPQLSTGSGAFHALVAETPIVARGPKPLAALRELGVTGAIPVRRRIRGASC
jgi:uroporphyrinogen-III synthase